MALAAGAELTIPGMRKMSTISQIPNAPRKNAPKPKTIVAQPITERAIIAMAVPVRPR